VRLAREGYNVALLARDAAQLEAARRAVLEAAPACEVMLLAEDAAQGAATARRVAERVAGKDLALLVNNVAMHSPQAHDLAHTPPGELERIVAVNVLFSVELTRLLLVPMRQRGRPSCVLNVSSLTSTSTMPFLSVCK
jgi:short-subunit dehydrogenase